LDPSCKRRAGKIANEFSPRFITTRDGTRLRTAVFAAASSRGVCALLGGQTEFIEKYVEVIGELNARGFTVATFDWRGQGGSARLLADPLKAHARDFAEYDDDLASFLEQVVEPLSPKPLALAHSMGGQILLRTLHDRPGAFAAAVLSAPGNPTPLPGAWTSAIRCFPLSRRSFVPPTAPVSRARRNS
jgi:lysophospholipase